MNQPSPGRQPSSRRFVSGSTTWWIVGGVAVFLAGLVATLWLLSGNGDESASQARPGTTVDSSAPAGADASEESDDGPGGLGEAATSDDPSPTPSPTPGAPPGVHGPRGAWLDPRYADGGSPISVTGDAAFPVGLSRDGSVFAYTVDGATVGVSVPGGEARWRYESFKCSEGSWDGVALCSDTGDPEPHLGERTGAGLVGLDLTDGSVAFTVEEAMLPNRLRFAGSDASAAYFVFSDMVAPNAGGDGSLGAMALLPGGEVLWRTDLQRDDVATQTALVSDGRVALRHDQQQRITLLDRTTGALEATIEGEHLALQWDGYTSFPSGGDFTFHRWSGEEAGIASSAQGSFGADPNPYFGWATTPVYSLEHLEIGRNETPTVVLAAPDGTEVVRTAPFELTARDGTSIDYSTIRSVDAGGQVVGVTDTRGEVRVHSLATGEALAAMSTSADTADIFVLDGVLVAIQYAGTGLTTSALLPGSASLEGP